MTLHIIPAYWKQITTEMRSGKFEITTNVPLLTNAVTAYLARNHIPYKRIKHGSGVYTFTSEVNTCPHCNGSGKC